MHRQPRHPLEAAVDHLAAAVEAGDHPAETAVWAVAALAHRLGVVAVIAPEEDAVVTVGEAWGDLVVEHLAQHPKDREAVIRVVVEVVQQVVDEVRERKVTGTAARTPCPGTP